MFVYFINDLEMYSKWEYSGESELLMLEYKEGILSFDNIMQFYLDKMMRDTGMSPSQSLNWASQLL